ncbi:hypothetical protein F5883DRAFT_148710 [Diaporthe sp. PMI_573]|nr:hypothetical protein F5883DRAFT_148710 [Diaporthaceae sp. PMI_573]
MQLPLPIAVDNYTVMVGPCTTATTFPSSGLQLRKVPPLQPAFQKIYFRLGLYHLSSSACATCHRISRSSPSQARDAVCRFETTRHVHPPPCSRSTASHLRTEYICLAVDARQWATEAGRMRVPTVNFAHFQCRPRATDRRRARQASYAMSGMPTHPHTHTPGGRLWSGRPLLVPTNQWWSLAMVTTGEVLVGSRSFLILSR